MDDTGPAVAGVIRCLEALGVEYVIVGSVASSIVGEVRTTHDVDLVAALQTAHATALADALGDAYYADPAMIRDEIQRGGMFNLIHRATMVKVDIFVDDGADFARSQMLRKREVELQCNGDSIRVYAASPEDVILAKLRWYRRGGDVSTVQWRDVIGVLAAQRKRLDRAYLRQWAETLGVLNLLLRASTAAHVDMDAPD